MPKIASISLAMQLAYVFSCLFRSQFVHQTTRNHNYAKPTCFVPRTQVGHVVDTQQSHPCEFLSSLWSQHAYPYKTLDLTCTSLMFVRLIAFTLLRTQLDDPTWRHLYRCHLLNQCSRGWAIFLSVTLNKILTPECFCKELSSILNK